MKNVRTDPLLVFIHARAYHNKTDEAVKRLIAEVATGCSRAYEFEEEFNAALLHSGLGTKPTHMFRCSSMNHLAFVTRHFMDGRKDHLMATIAERAGA